MGDSKSPEDVLGFEYDWIASDGSACVGFFATAGGGYAPAEFLKDTDVHYCAIEAIGAMQPRTSVAFLSEEDGDLSTWTRMAERGLFAFDADSFGGPYRLIAAPANPIQVHELPDGAAQVVLRLRFPHLSFRDARELSIEHFTNAKSEEAAIVGVAEHSNSAVLVTVSSRGELLDRRRIELTDRGLPTHPHHHEGSWAVGRYLNTPGARVMSLADAVALVERVRDSAARGARGSLESVANVVPVPIVAIAIRACPELPPTIEERIADNRAQTFADSVMYREALATAANARGWTVHWYDRDHVFRDAATALGREDIDAFLHAMGKAVGPPWQAKHKLAAAAALAVTNQSHRA